MSVTEETADKLLVDGGAKNDMGIFGLAINRCITLLISVMVRSGPPTMLTRTASEAPRSWPFSREGWAKSFSRRARRDFRTSLGGGERTGSMPSARHGAEIGEIDVDQTRLGQQTPDATQTVGEEGVADFKPSSTPVFSSSNW